MIDCGWVDVWCIFGEFYNFPECHVCLNVCLQGANNVV